VVPIVTSSCENIASVLSNFSTPSFTVGVSKLCCDRDFCGVNCLVENRKVEGGYIDSREGEVCSFTAGWGRELGFEDSGDEFGDFRSYADDASATHNDCNSFGLCFCHCLRSIWVIWNDEITVKIRRSKHLKSRDLRVYILSSERTSLGPELSFQVFSAFASKVIGQLAVACENSLL
jgi:hypothetical protein